MTDLNQDVSSKEMRLNPLTGEWIIYAPERGNRPDSKNKDLKFNRPVYSYEATCPFCPGNERMLPEILMEINAKEGNWQVRIVPNRYPAVTPSASKHRKISGIYQQRERAGNHEVVIESPLHNRIIELMSSDEAGSLIEAYHRRYAELTKDLRNKTIILFRNHGTAAGTSISHPHSQIITLGIVPKAVRTRQRSSIAYSRRKNRCLICDIVEYELKKGIRLLYENKSFTCFIPFFAEVSCEVWIVPKIHRTDFRDITDGEKPDFADSLQKVLSSLKIQLNDPCYNYVIQGNSYYSDQEKKALHWYLQIKPRIETPAGFEMGSGMHINTSLPESDAVLLKSGI
jgi:UDPglucose--hexose-1-phosphate uridylyltransferase